MNDLISQLGYADGSPYRHNPYLDINTPEGLIDMANTSMDLLGVDNLGNVKKMKAGRKNPYKFPGTQVREIPMQTGGLYATNKAGFVDSVMNANKNLNFVQRYLYPGKYPTIPNPDGTYSTHLMASSDNISYPTIVQGSNGQLQKLTPQQAYDYAIKNKQYIQFPADEQADWFSNNGYKMGKHFQNGGTLPPGSSLVRRNYTPSPVGNKVYPTGTQITYPGDTLTDPQLERAAQQYNQMITDSDTRAAISAGSPTFGRRVFPNAPIIAGPNAYYMPSSKDSTKLSSYNTPPSIFKGYSGSDYELPSPPAPVDWSKFVPPIPRSNISTTGVRRPMIPTGNIYQRGGMTQKDIFNFLLNDEEDDDRQNNVPTAPSTVEVAAAQPAPEQPQNDPMEEMAMQIATEGNPYRQSLVSQAQNYQGPILSSGQFGNQNVGPYGRQIYGQLSQDLGYTPTVNSIFRSPEQQAALMRAGKPAVKNSFHLSGNAIDLKPEDWNKLTQTQQKYYRTNYDVIYHNNHFHIEPKG